MITIIQCLDGEAKKLGYASWQDLCARMNHVDITLVVEEVVLKLVNLKN